MTATINLPCAQYVIARELPLAASDPAQGISIVEATDDRVPRRWRLDYVGVPAHMESLLWEAFTNADHRAGAGELSFTAPDASVVVARTTEQLSIGRRSAAQIDASVEVVEYLSRD